jgi:hypothetical protein
MHAVGLGGNDCPGRRFRAEHGPNVFDVQQVRDEARRCAGIHRDIAALRDAIAATAVPFEEEVTQAP